MSEGAKKLWTYLASKWRAALGRRMIGNRSSRTPRRSSMEVLPLMALDASQVLVGDFHARRTTALVAISRYSLRP